MKKSKIKLILEDHWSDFLKIYSKKLRKNVKLVARFIRING